MVLVLLMVCLIETVAIRALVVERNYYKQIIEEQREMIKREIIKSWKRKSQKKI